MIWGRSNQNKAPVAASVAENVGETGSLTASETFYDFGTISMKDGKVSHLFNITNETSQDVTLKRLTTSCMCTTAFIVNGEDKKGPFGMPGHGGPVPNANEIIKSGETQGIEVVFDPNAHGPAGVGKIERVIRMEAENGGALELNIKAMVTP